MRKTTDWKPPNLPDDIGEIEWEDDLRAIYAAEKELARRWHRWNKAKALIDADWKAQAEKELAAVTGEIETGLLLNRLESEREADLAADEETTRRYLEELAALRDKAWRSRAEKQLADATKKINAEIRKRDRANRELLKARRSQF